MGVAAVIGVEMDTSALRGLGRALAAEADGKQLRKDLAREIRQSLEPGKAEVIGRVHAAMPSGSSPREGPPLRAAVARSVKVEARLSGRSTGARIKVTKRGMPRRFVNAPKRLNADGGWSHPVFGRPETVTQRGAPGWFDDTLAGHGGRYRAAVVAAMESAARRIASRVR